MFEPSLKDFIRPRALFRDTTVRDLTGSQDFDAEFGPMLVDRAMRVYSQFLLREDTDMTIAKGFVVPAGGESISRPRRPDAPLQ